MTSTNPRQSSAWLPAAPGQVYADVCEVSTACTVGSEEHCELHGISEKLSAGLGERSLRLQSSREVPIIFELLSGRSVKLLSGSAIGISISVDVSAGYM